jgi:hypothetical protein
MPFTKQQIRDLRANIAQRLVELLARDSEGGEKPAEIAEIPETPVPVRVESTESREQFAKSHPHLFHGMLTAGACKVVSGDMIVYLAEVQSRTSGHFDSVAWLTVSMDDWLYSVSLSRDSKSQEVDTDLVHDTIGLGGWQSTSVEEFSDQWELVLRQGDGEVEKDELPPIKGHGYEHDA